MLLDLVATLFESSTCARLMNEGMTGSRNASGMNRVLTRFERSSGLVSGSLKINRKVVGFLQSFLQSGLQHKEEDPPELQFLAGLAMSGRLDSNQRPPEPHSGGTGHESRKNRLFLSLRIPYFPHFTRRTPHFPQNPLSFLPFPTRGIWPVAPEVVAKRAASPGRFDTSDDVSEADWRKCGSCVGGADRSSSAVWFAPSGSCRCGRRAASRPPPRRAPLFLECSSSLSQTVPPSTSLLPDGSLAPVLSEELSCDVPC